MRRVYQIHPWHVSRYTARELNMLREDMQHLEAQRVSDADA